MSTHKAAALPGAPLLVAKGHAAPTRPQADAAAMPERVAAGVRPGARVAAAARLDAASRDGVPAPVSASGAVAPLRRAAGDVPPPAAALTGAILRERGLAAHVAAGLAEARLPGAELRTLRRPAADPMPGDAVRSGERGEGRRGDAGDPAAPSGGTVRLTVTVDRRLHRRLRLAATHLGRPNRALVADALSDFLDGVAVGEGRHCACLSRPGDEPAACAGSGPDCPGPARGPGR